VYMPEKEIELMDLSKPFNRLWLSKIVEREDAGFFLVHFFDYITDVIEKNGWWGDNNGV